VIAGNDAKAVSFRFAHMSKTRLIGIAVQLFVVLACIKTM
jgi:hypothetical protein